jgi:hypothetical protein
MHPLPSRKVDFMKKRDFSAIFSDGFKFFKSNFKVLIPAVLIIVGPLAVAVSGIQGYLHSQGVQAFSLFNLHRLLYYIVEDDTKYYLNLLQLVLTVIVSIVSMALLGRFFVLYQQSESIAIKDIFSHLVKDSVRVFLNYLFMMLFAILLGLIIFGFLQIPILNWILGIVGFIIFCSKFILLNFS